MRIVVSGRERQLEVVKQMRYHLPVFRKITDGELRELMKVFFDAGWTAEDIFYALDNDPEGNAITFNRPTGSTPAPQVEKWVKRRLELWRDSSNEPFASRTQTAAAMRRAHNSQAAAQRIDYEKMARMAVPAASSPGHSLALRQVRVAAGLARDARAEANRRELAERRATFRAAREQEALRQRTLALLDAVIANPALMEDLRHLD